MLNSQINKKSYYTMLDLESDASISDIKQAYKKLALKYHPDRNKEADAESKFKDISKAYQTLSDSEKKKKYDLFGSVDESIQNNEFHFDIFNQFFGDFSKSFGNIFTEQNIIKSKNKCVDIPIPLSFIYFGKKEKITYKKIGKCKGCNGSGAENSSAIQDCIKCFGQGTQTTQRTLFPGMTQEVSIPCNNCNGTGKIIDSTQYCKKCNGNKINELQEITEIYIQPGMDFDDTIVINEGASINNINQIPGDLILKLKQKDFYYERVGPHLYKKYTISLLDALTGVQIFLEHPSNKNFKIDYDNVINPDTVLELKDLGMPYLDNSAKYGNLYISFDIQFPKNVSNERKKYLKKILPINNYNTELTNYNNVNNYNIVNNTHIEEIKKNYMRTDDLNTKTNNNKYNHPIPDIIHTQFNMDESPSECLQQ